MGTSLLTILALFSVAMLAGGLGALAGLGGGIIIVPVLTLFFKVDLHSAIGASIVAVLATSCGAAVSYLKANLTNLKVGLFLELATTVGALTGAFVGIYLVSSILFGIFGFILGLSAYLMWRKRHQELPGAVIPDEWSRKLALGEHYYDAALRQEVYYEVQGAKPALALMYLAGVVSGLLGIGSGGLKVLAMDLAMKLPIKVSSATSNFMIGVTAIASVSVYFSQGYINPYLTAPIALGVLLGSFVGSKLLIHLRGQLIRGLFIGILAVLAGQMLLKSVGIGF